MKGVDEWKKALAQVLSNYSATEEAKNANILIEKIEKNKNLKESGVVYKNYKWIFPFLSTESKLSQQFFEKLKAALTIKKNSWTVSLDPFNEEYTFVVVHGIRDLKEIKNIETNDGISDLVLQNGENFVALASQYRAIIKNKNWKTLRDESN